MVQSTFYVFLILKDTWLITRGVHFRIINYIFLYYMIVNNFDIIGNEHLWRTRCNLKTEFRDGRYGLNQNFILCLGSKYPLPGFCSKAIYIHILNGSIWKGILWLFYLMIEEDYFYTIVIELRYWDKWSIISMLFVS